MLVGEEVGRNSQKSCPGIFKWYSHFSDSTGEYLAHKENMAICGHT